MKKKTTIFYLVDGARYDMMKDLLEAGELPNVQNHILNQGTFRKATSCFPSTTGPAYLPHLTGCFPGTSDITGIRWFDKKEFRRKRFNKMAMRSYCGPEAAWFNTDMPTDRPTLHELLGNTYNIFSMITRNIPEERDLAKKGKSGLYIRAHFLHQHTPVDEAAHHHLMRGLDLDPSFIFTVFPCVDWNSHTYQPQSEQTIESYRFMDKSVGESVAKLKKLGKWEDTLFVITSDHGLTATNHHFDLAKYFSQKGLKALQYPTIFTIRPKTAVMISGNSFGAVHFLHHEGSEVLRGEAVQNAMGEATWKDLIQQAAIDFVTWRGTYNDYWVESKKGRAQIKNRPEGLSYHPQTGDPFDFGLMDRPMDQQQALEATFDSDYPDALVQIAQLFKSRRAGDLVVGAANGYDLRDTWEYPEHRGSHGSLCKEHMHVPFIYNQVGWDPRPARTADIFNSICAWMGVEVPHATDGRSLCQTTKKALL
ncbi:MAG: alkaline phosphatase family protein [Bacteroidota bacterium]